MGLQFENEVTDLQRVVIVGAFNDTLIAAEGDSNDRELEALNELIDALMAYAGIKDDGETTAARCDNCDEVSVELTADDLCPTCDAEEKHD